MLWAKVSRCKLCSSVNGTQKYAHRKQHQVLPSCTWTFERWNDAKPICIRSLLVRSVLSYFKLLRSFIIILIDFSFWWRSLTCDSQSCNRHSVQTDIVVLAGDHVFGVCMPGQSVISTRSETYFVKGWCLCVFVTEREREWSRGQRFTKQSVFLRSSVK